MLNWFTKEKVSKAEIISLNPIVLSSFKHYNDGGFSFKVTRGKTEETFRVYGGDRVEIMREISISLLER